MKFNYLIKNNIREEYSDAHLSSQHLGGRAGGSLISRKAGLAREPYSLVYVKTQSPKTNKEN